MAKVLPGETSAWPGILTLEHFSSQRLLIKYFSKSPRPPEAVKNWFRYCFMSFRGNPESSVLSVLEILWSLVFTGETNKILFFDVLPLAKGGGIDPRRMLRKTFGFWIFPEHLC